MSRKTAIQILMKKIIELPSKHKTIRSSTTRDPLSERYSLIYVENIKIQGRTPSLEPFPKAESTQNIR